MATSLPDRPRPRPSTPSPTPTASFSLSFSFPTTSPHNTKTPPPSFPPASTFDILPAIHHLISRLPPGSGSISDSADNNINNNNNTPSIPPIPLILPTTTTTTTTSSNNPSDPHDPKDLPQAALPIKLKIQKARAAVAALPDVDRCIEEQEDEMAALEARIGALMGVLGELARRAAAAGPDAVHRQVTEGGGIKGE